MSAGSWLNAGWSDAAAARGARITRANSLHTLAHILAMEEWGLMECGCGVVCWLLLATLGGVHCRQRQLTAVVLSPAGVRQHKTNSAGVRKKISIKPAFPPTSSTPARQPTLSTPACPPTSSISACPPTSSTPAFPPTSSTPARQPPSSTPAVNHRRPHQPV